MPEPDISGDLFICGVTTQVCVNATVREANNCGFRLIVLGDCCASYFPEFHKVGLEMIGTQGGHLWLGIHVAARAPRPGLTLSRNRRINGHFGYRAAMSALPISTPLRRKALNSIGFETGTWAPGFHRTSVTFGMGLANAVKLGASALSHHRLAGAVCEIHSSGSIAAGAGSRIVGDGCGTVL